MEYFIAAAVIVAFAAFVVVRIRAKKKVVSGTSPGAGGSSTGKIVDHRQH